MASIKPRKNNAGEIISYEIAVFKGRDVNGKQEFYRTTWKPDPSWAPRTKEKKLADFARDFERDCKEGKVLTKAERKQQEKELEEERARTITFRRYAEETYLPRKTATLSVKTIDAYTRIKDIFCATFGEMPIADIRPIDITNFLLPYRPPRQNE